MFTLRGYLTIWSVDLSCNIDNCLNLSYEFDLNYTYEHLAVVVDPEVLPKFY